MRAVSSSSGASSGSNDHPRSLQHWAAKIGEIVYEVAQDQETATFDVETPSFWSWKDIHKKFQTLKLGKTCLSDERLHVIAALVWDIFNHKKYDIFRQNCQAFVEVFYALIEEGNGSSVDWPNKLDGEFGMGAYSMSPKSINWLRILRHEANGKILSRVEDIEPLLVKVEHEYEVEERQMTLLADYMTRFPYGYPLAGVRSLMYTGLGRRD